MKTDELGKWGENLAYNYLTSHGYAIVDQNWRMEHFEIDIIAMKEGRLVFVEVKTRSDINGDPIEAITRRKIMNMVQSANAFVQMRDMPHEIQFDIITISGTPEEYKLEHLPDAFDPPLKTY